MPFVEQYYWMCSHVFRDAIVFYSEENEITEILHICFGCDWMLNKDGQDLEVDAKIFPPLKKIFQKIGHQIED